ncbi:MlaC/ttg2D family ABC transporter substrate-binding protein [Malaciobacter marinus]|jgi:phospholipid transport system substrate-binding protein|uniref:Phospholipid transport system substrate-binding protein n=1 Tax=Malaciobacter marinus TaxID=505249 RepID=A0AB36ZYS3_9BACT|nr:MULTISPECIES: ABC transporter substrate-binding protein [Malaciobacter]PHO13045.1 toluene tolerance protein [Malaciobacter marinus]PPK62114.1 phospholipid transport system substrate-binding protein [Malaciobacter marinus]RYA22407.1 toluene tolerance protein [Malaciobacter halophilus]SKB28085.1 phospholipid transport system substrate-binding protein [Malaciobacter marinus]
MLKNLLIIACLINFAFAMPKDNIKEDMTENIYKVIDILKNKELAKKEKGKQIIKVMDSSFDYKIMAMLSLGKQWRTISNEQRADFSKAFENRLKDSYIDKLDLYHDQEIKIDKLKEIKTRLVLKTLLIGEKENFAIDYKLYENKKNKQWYIYDVSIAEVSIIQTYRNQFSQYLKNKSIDDLIEYLNNKNKQA